MVALPGVCTAPNVPVACDAIVSESQDLLYKTGSRVKPLGSYCYISAVQYCDPISVFARYCLCLQVPGTSLCLGQDDLKGSVTLV